MSRILEDVLCGVLGYNIGVQKNNKITQEESELLIHSFLSQVPLDAVIDYWIEANNCNTVEKYIKVKNILRDKADYITDYII